MDPFEYKIATYQKRIKAINASPDPMKMKSNGMLYELLVEEIKAQQEAWHNGRPTLGGGVGLWSLTQSMGFVPAETPGTLTIRGNALKDLETARQAGFPVDRACDQTVLPRSRSPEEIEDISIGMCDQHSCTAGWLAGLYRLHTDTENRFNYFFDLGFEDSEANLQHVVAQLKEFIAFVESKKIPGIKFDEDKLIELQRQDEKARSYYYDIYRMLSTRPCPISGKDVTRQIAAAPPGMYPNPARAVEYAKMRRDEIAERVKNGVAAVPGEKLRVMWTVSRPFYMDPYAILEKMGVAIPVFYSGPLSLSMPMPGPHYWGDRKLSPLEVVASEAICTLWGGRGTKWISNMLRVCQELKIDAIVNYCMIGCTATLGLKSLVEDAAKKQLGIPTLQVTGKQWDPAYASIDSVTSELEEFVQLCLRQPNLRKDGIKSASNS